MNEELQKELLSILRAMKDGAPDAFNVLVSQRSDYCSMLAWGQGVLFLVCLLGMLICLCILKRGRSIMEDLGDEVGDVIIVVDALMAVILLVLAVASLSECFSKTALAVAPLGQVLGALR